MTQGDLSFIKQVLQQVCSDNCSEKRDCYRILTSAIVPRPIAFVSSLSEDGIPNLAPFRFVGPPSPVRIYG